MPYFNPETQQIEETEEERKRRQEIADTAVQTTETKTYGDGTVEKTTTQEIPPAPVNPADFGTRVGNAVSQAGTNFVNNLNQGVENLKAAPGNFVNNVQQVINPDQAAYTRQQESGNRPNIGYHFPADAQGRRQSTAYGPYGITAPAYQDIVKQNPALNKPITEWTQQEHDIGYNTLLGRNQARLTQLGIEPTNGALQLSHLLGPDGAARFMKTGQVSDAAAAANGGVDKLKAIAQGRLQNAPSASSGAAQPQAQQPITQGFQGQTNEFGGMEEQPLAQTAQPVSPESMYSLATGTGQPGLRVPQAPQAQPVVDVTKTAIDRYQQVQDNPMELLKLHQDETQPEFIRRRAGENISQILNDQRNLTTAEATLPTLSQADLAKIATKKSEGNSVGDWLQYLLFKHVGLNDLANAKGEQLGIGHKWEGAMDAQGNSGLIKYSANGRPLEGTKSDGTPMTKDELTAYASQGLGKASDVSLTMHQALVNGELHTFESKRTPQGLLYRDSTANGSWSRTAPQGMTNIGQQDPAHVKGLTAANSVVTRMSKANADSIAAVGRPQFTQEQIQEARNQAYSNVTGKPYTGTAVMSTQAGTAPAPTAPAAGTAPAPSAQAAPAKAPKSLAQQILDYEAPPPVGPSTGTKIAIINEVNRLAAEQGKAFNAGNFAIASKFNNSMSGKALKSINVAVDHLDTLQEAANELKNGQTPAFNKIANLYASNTGSTAPGNFDALKSIVGSEVAKAVVGGASALGDREEIRKEISNAKTPEQLAGVIGRFQALMAGQAKGIRQEWVSSGLDEDRFDAKLMPRTKVVLNKQKEPSRSNY